MGPRNLQLKFKVTIYSDKPQVTVAEYNIIFNFCRIVFEQIYLIKRNGEQYGNERIKSVSLQQHILSSDFLQKF